MFTLFPPRLKEVLQLGLNAAHKVLLANSAPKHVGKEEDIVDTLGVGSKRKRHVVMYGSESGEMVKQKSENSFFLDQDDKVWHNSARCGYTFVDIEPGSNRWYTCTVNDCIADFAGMHREEFLARMANFEMALTCSEFRQFCGHISALLFQLTKRVKDGEQHFIYTRWTPGYGREEKAPGKILRSCFTMHGDENNFLSHMKRTMVMITDEEYDRIAKLAPHSCDQLASAVVGRKSAAELNSREILDEECFATMTSSETGRAQLDLLANVLEAQFAPILKRASTL
jgi:hypothetical protein